MAASSIVLLVLLGITLLITFFIGYRRGIFPTIIRMATIALSFVLAFIFSGKIVSSQYFETIEYSADLNETLVALLSNEGFSDYVIFLLKTLFRPFVFVVIFAVANLITLIIYAPLKRIFVNKNRKPGFVSKITGAALSLILSCCMFVGYTFFIPGLVKMASSTSDVVDKYVLNVEVVDITMDFVESESEGFMMNAINACGGKLIWDTTTKADVAYTDKDGNEVVVNDTLDDEIGALITIASKVDIPEDLTSDGSVDLDKVLTVITQVIDGLKEANGIALNKALASLLSDQATFWLDPSADIKPILNQPLEDNVKAPLKPTLELLQNTTPDVLVSNLETVKEALKVVVSISKLIDPSTPKDPTEPVQSTAEALKELTPESTKLVLDSITSTISEGKDEAVGTILSGLVENALANKETDSESFAEDAEAIEKIIEIATSEEITEEVIEEYKEIINSSPAVQKTIEENKEEIEKYADLLSEFGIDVSAFFK